MFEQVYNPTFNRDYNPTFGIWHNEPFQLWAVVDLHAETPEQMLITLSQWEAVKHTVAERFGATIGKDSENTVYRVDTVVA